jgi:hypothetical protein
MVLCVALVISISGVANSAKVSVGYTREGTTSFKLNCGGRDISLTRTAKNKLNYVSGTIIITVKEALSLGKGSEIGGVVFQNDFNVNADMGDNEIKGAMEGICGDNAK